MNDLSMGHSEFRITLHMVSSLDGFIARKDESVDWMQSTGHYEAGKVLSEEEIEGFLNGIDCYVMGARTYEHALQLGWPYGDTQVYVFSHREQKSDRKNVKFYSSDIQDFVDNELKPKYSNVWLVGGAMLARAFLTAGLVDDVVQTVAPIILGEGLPFFDQIKKELPLKLKDVIAYQDGMVELHYTLRKS